MSDNGHHRADALPRYPDFASYPNVYTEQTLKLDDRRAIASCSCGRWEAEHFPERQLVRTHQFHILNLSAV